MADETTERPLARVKYKEDETSGFLPKKEAVTPVIIPSPVKAYTHNMGRSRVVSAMWEAPEWDLAEVGRIIDVEAYVRRAFAVREALFMKEGYEFVGQNPTRVSYVRRRFQQIEAATGIPIKILFQRTVGSLIALHNAFWVKKRDKKASGGKSYKLNGQTFDPVAGYFIAPAETIRFKRDEYGRILKYRQSVWGKEEVEFNPEDVIHFYFDKRDGFSVGTPITVPIKDDIRALRRIEENIELLYYQYLFPLFHYKVGTEKNPAMTFPDGTTEIELVQRELASMPSDGLWVTPERHEIEVKGSEGKALDPKDVLEHFKQRVFSGLGVSNVDMGEGGSANRCFDKDTQILTDHGWKYYWEYSENDLVATINRDSQQLEFQEPKDGLLLFDYEGELHKVKNRHIDLCITPNHKLYYGNYKYKKAPVWEFREVGDIRVKKFCLLTSSSETKNIERINFNLPQIDYDKRITNHENLGPFNNINMDDWLEFLGYFISEGTLAKVEGKWALSISQSNRVNLGKVVKIRSLLERLPFKFNEYISVDGDECSRFWINCKSLWVYLADSVGTYSDNKKIPREFLSLSARQLKILLNALVLGDGSFDSRENRKGFCYYSSSKELLDNVQELALRIGWRSALGPAHQGVGRVNFHPKAAVEVRTSQIEKIFYRDKVWCFETQNHTLVVRRNGKISIQGNSTAQTLSRNLIDRTKSEQRIFEDFINTFVIKELLRESTFPEESLDDEENQVYLVFKEIDNEVKQALENHCSQMYMQNLLSHDEARDAIGKEPFTEEDWLNSYWRQIEEPKVLMQSLDEPWSAESKAVARSNATSVTEGDIEEETEVAEQHRKEELAAKKVAKTAKPVARPAKASGSAANKNKPRNQHGTRSSAKLNKDCYDSYDARATSELNSIFAQRPPLSTVLYDLEKDVRGMVSNGGWDKETAKIVFGIAFETGRNKLVDHAKRAYRIGINDTSKPYYEINLAPTDAKIERHVTRFTNKLRDYVFEQVESNLVGVKELSVVDAEAASIIFKVLAHRAKMIDEGEIRRAYNAGLADGYKAQGAEEISLLCSDSQPCEICSKSTLRWKTGDAIIYEELPPLHPECNCRLTRN